MPSLQTIITMAALAGMNLEKEIERLLPAEKKVKNCLHCGEEHQHNNSFCSAKCFKEHKEN